MTRDFTLSRYEALCKALISSGYRSITVQEYIQDEVAEPFVIMRHDVDRRYKMEIEPFVIQEEISLYY
jgi:hypothetical protein